MLVHVHDAEAGGLLHGDLHHRDGAGCPRRLVPLQHLLVVHLIDVVTGEDQDIVGVVQGNEADVLVDGVGRPLVPGTLVPPLDVGGQDVDATVGTVQVPGLAVSNVAVEFQGLILGEDADSVDAGIHTVGQGKVDDPELAPEGDGWLGHLAGEGLQPAALASRQEHGHTCLLHSITSWLKWGDRSSHSLGAGFRSPSPA